MFINAELSQLPIGEGRTAGRRIVNLAAALREDGASTKPVIVIDISVGGFKAEAGEHLELGTEVWLKLAGFEARRSRVVWSEGEQAGCEFESPLHERDIAMISAPRPRTIARNLFRRV